MTMENMEEGVLMHISNLIRLRSIIIKERLLRRKGWYEFGNQGFSGFGN